MVGDNIVEGALFSSIAMVIDESGSMAFADNNFGEIAQELVDTNPAVTENSEFRIVGWNSLGISTNEADLRVSVGGGETADRELTDWLTFEEIQNLFVFLEATGAGEEFDFTNGQIPDTISGLTIQFRNGGSGGSDGSSNRDAQVFPDTAPIVTIREGFKSLVDSINEDGFGPTTTIKVFSFDSNVTESQEFNAETEADAIKAFIDDIVPGGATDYDGALRDAGEWLATRGTDDKLVFFLSDGEDNQGGGFNAGPLVDLYGTNAIEVRAFGFAVGDGGNLNETQLNAVAGLGENPPGADPDFSQFIKVDPGQGDDLTTALTLQSIGNALVGEDVIFGGDATGGSFNIDDVIFGDNLGLDFEFIAAAGTTFNSAAEAEAAFNADKIGFIKDHGVSNTSLMNALGSVGVKDYIEGGLGNDVIHGQGGNDIILGGGGDDIIFGGRGTDVLSGGEGADTFVVTIGDVLSDGTVDGITDFTEEDTLDISNLLESLAEAAGVPLGGNVDNFVRFVDDNGDAVVEIDVTGSGGTGGGVWTEAVRAADTTVDTLQNNTTVL